MAQSNDIRLAKMRAYGAKRRARVVADGLCLDCKAVVTAEGKSRCPSCLGKRAVRTREKRAARRAAGTCIRALCGRPAAKGGYCAECYRVALEGQRRHAAGNRAKGLCKFCSKPGLADGTRCLDCWLKRLAQLHTGSKTNVPALLALFEKQGGRCALTGSVLEFGYNASIDHVLPLARGGKRELSNVRWLDYTTNMCRRNLTDDEFLSLANNLVLHQMRLNAARRGEGS